MRIAMLMLAVCLFAAAALAQTTTTTTTTTVMTAGTAGTVVCPTAACPPMVMTGPQACAAISTPAITGERMILVLGSEEYYGLSNLNDVGWENAPRNYTSRFELGNPLTHHRVNMLVTRHGNPFSPYFQTSPGVDANIASACLPNN